MSLLPRIVLASVAALFGVMMVAIAPPTDKAIFFYVFGGFCLVIAVACVARGRVASFFGSLVASGVLLSGVWYAWSMLGSGPLDSGRRSDPSVLNAAMFLLVFCVPSAVYLWRIRFGLSAVKVANHSGDNEHREP